MAGVIPEIVKEQMQEYFEKHRIPEDRRESMTEIVRDLYQRSAYDAEEPIGVVCAQSLSEPATQMSIDHGEKVIVKHGGVIRIVRIGEFIDNLVNEEGHTEPDGWDVIDVSGKGIFVPSLNSSEKIEWRQVKELSRHKAPDYLLELRTRSGRRISATDSHSYVTRKGNMIVAVPGKELSPGDRIPSMLYLPENCIQAIQTREYLPDQRFSKRQLPESISLTKELGWFMGAYLAEGNCTEFYTSLSNTDSVFQERVRQFARDFGFSFNEYENLRGFRPSHDIRINSKQLSRFLIRTCRTGSSRKRVPEFAFSANRDFVSGLLSGYFDGDGNISVERRVIRVSSRSSELLNGIALLLSRFRIFARKMYGKENCLVIPYKYSVLFRDEIGFSNHLKSMKLDILSGEFMENRERYQDFVDMIGGFGDILLKLCRKLGLPSRIVGSPTRRQKIGRLALERHIQTFEKAAKSRGIDISKEMAILRTMADSDVIWDEIVRIRRVKPSHDYVYDFTVPGAETFTTFDGIVTHNTMRTYHFAGTAGIQVTLGLPRMLEIFDARKEPRTPTMTVYLKPEYQDINKVREIASRIMEVKAKNIILSTTIDLTELWIKCRLDLKKLESMGIPQEKASRIIKLRNTETSMEGPDVIVVKSKKADLKNLHKLKYAVLESHVKGIKGISQVVVTKEEDEWVINTLGSSLMKVFEIEGVDYTRTYSNNVFEVLDVLGVEAARTAIIKQAQYTMQEQGLGVDVRYVMLLADLMSMQGDIRAIGRYGISGQKASVLVRASFEETKKHLTAASIKGETDHLHGTVENIMMNQVAPIGTGAFRLVGTIPEFGVVSYLPDKSGSRKAPARKPAAKKPPAKKPAAKKAEPKKPSTKPAAKKTDKTKAVSVKAVKKPAKPPAKKTAPMKEKPAAKKPAGKK